MSGQGRRWLELSVRGSADADTDSLLTEVLLGAGGRAVEERAGWLVTHLPEPADPDSFLETVAEDLMREAGLEQVEMNTVWREHEDWAETWKRGLAPRRLTDRLVVRPSWEEVPDPRPGDLTIVLDPGMAFGTAEHGTTRGCLRLLDGVVREGDRLLDVGSGSGILSIAAALMGAVEVVAVDMDPLACEALDENVERNGVADRVFGHERLADAAWLSERGPRSGVIANIESGVLLPLLPGLVAAIEPGGWLILSGILDHEWSQILEAAAPLGLASVEVDADGMWRSGLFRRLP